MVMSNGSLSPLVRGPSEPENFWLMMPNSAGFAHPGGADDDRGIFQIVQLHRMSQLANIRQIFHAEGILLLAQEFVDAFVEAFGMEAKDFCGIHAKRAIDENRHARQLVGQSELVQGVDDLLGSANGKRRYDHQPFACESCPHKLPHLFIREVFA